MTSELTEIEDKIKRTKLSKEARREARRRLGTSASCFSRRAEASSVPPSRAWCA